MLLTSQHDCTFCQTLILVPLCLHFKETSYFLSPGSIIFISDYFWTIWQNLILLLAHKCTSYLLHASLSLNNAVSVHLSWQSQPVNCSILLPSLHATAELIHKRCLSIWCCLIRGCCSASGGEEEFKLHHHSPLPEGNSYRQLQQRLIMWKAKYSLDRDRSFKLHRSRQTKLKALAERRLKVSLFTSVPGKTSSIHHRPGKTGTGVTVTSEGKEISLCGKKEHYFCKASMSRYQ